MSVENQMGGGAMRTLRIVLVALLAIVLQANSAGAGQAFVDHTTNAGFYANLTDCPATITTTCHAWNIAGQEYFGTTARVWVRAYDVAPGANPTLVAQGQAEPAVLELTRFGAAAEATVPMSSGTSLDLDVVLAAAGTRTVTVERDYDTELTASVRTKLDVRASASGTIDGATTHQAPEPFVSGIWWLRAVSADPAA
jgi:hypothetical protein